MKKISIYLTSVIVLIVLLSGVRFWLSHQHKTTEPAGRVLNLYNWGDYIDPQLLSDFTRETGYAVRYETFDSNESMYTKIKQGGTDYDVAVPSDYMVAKLRREKLLKPLDASKLVGLANNNPRFLDQGFDPANQYSVPYFWGTLGILYDDRTVAAADVQHWQQLWSPRFQHRLMMVDSARDGLAVALLAQGQSVNTHDLGTLQAAQDKLQRLMPNVKAVVGDEIKTYMAQGEADLAVTYSGEAAAAMRHNSHLHYLVPEEGSNLWLDNLVVPTTAQHLGAAYAFLNFMSRPENAARNAAYIGYATPNAAAQRLLPRRVTADPAFYLPQARLARLQMYDALSPAWTQRYNDAFLEFKMTPQTAYK